AKPPDQIPNGYFVPRNEDAPKTLVKTWYPVRPGGPEMLETNADRTLFLCWPPYLDDMAHQCLQYYQGNLLVFIGESSGGCTGNDAFFECLGAEWNEVAHCEIAQWFGMHDAIFVYERRKDSGP